MINLAGRGNYSDIKKLAEEREKNGKTFFNDKAHPLEKSRSLPTNRLTSCSIIIFNTL